jgi:hypothetical protein
VPIVRGRTRRNSPSLHAAVHLAFTAKTARTPRKWVNSFITYWQGNFANIDTPATRFMGEAWLIRRLQQTGPNARRTLSMAFAAYLAICSISNFVLFIYCSLRALGVFAVRNEQKGAATRFNRGRRTIALIPNSFVRKRFSSAGTGLFCADLPVF